MLTCKVGESIVNTFSFKDEKLREWSNKGMLKCPVCNEKMIYCHGDFKIPYFRHEKNSDCPDIYSEGITEEHLKGTQVIYEWLQTQEGIIDLQLEKWIPETRQRPDIYFEREENGVIKKYAIEFQCSPISTKYNERHDLYRLNNINDIWILGVYKYNIRQYNNILLKHDINNQILENIKTKTIEREIEDSENPLIYLVDDKLIKLTDEFIETYDDDYNERKTIFDFNIDSKLIYSCDFQSIIDNNSLYLIDKTELGRKINMLKEYVDNLNKYIIINKYNYEVCINNDYIELKIIRNSLHKIYSQKLEIFTEGCLCECYEKEIGLYKMKIDLFNNLKMSCELLNKRFSIVNKNCNFDFKNNDNNGLYLYKIEFDCNDFNRIFYIKEKSTDCTIEDSYTTPFRSKRGGIGWKRNYYNKTIDKFEYDEIDINKIVDYISNSISDTLRNIKYGSDLK